MSKEVETMLRTHILGVLEDTITDFVYYDREEDDELDVEELQEAFDSGIVTIDDAVATFRKALADGLGLKHES